MTLLIIGLGLWCAVHLLPSLASGIRGDIVRRLGIGMYKLIFSLCLLVAIILIVLGWRSMTPGHIYTPPVWGRHVTLLLVLFTFYLFAVAHSKSNIKRFLRHPQLTGLLLWSIGHLLANGDRRSLLLFPVMFIWALVEMYCINRRQGAWQKPVPVSMGTEFITAIKGIALYMIFLFAHPYLTGIAIINR